MAGLPIEKILFAIFPPHFTNRDIALFSVRKYLPFLRNHLCAVGGMTLASLTYHCDWIRKNSKNNVAMNSALFMSPQDLVNLSQFICCNPESACMTSTGFQPHLTALKEFIELHPIHESFLQANKSIPEKIANISIEEL